MFGYLSIADLTDEIRRHLHRVPRDIELVVGIPRSGMIPAYTLGLFMNRHVTDVLTFIGNGALSHGQTRATGVELAHPLAARHILLMDDSVSSGASLQSALNHIRAAGYTGRITTCAAVVTPDSRHSVDVWFRSMPHPRVFEWNAFHHPAIDRSCFDLDGVLCVDPTEAENDDGERYREFLANARPLFKPTGVIAHIVSARLEKYRDLTEAWLQAQGIRYGRLHLMDLPTKEARLKAGGHGRHKAAVYKAHREAFLFFESDSGQAREIAHLSGKPVLCVADMRVHLPQAISSPSALMGHAKWRLRAPVERLRRQLRRFK